MHKIQVTLNEGQWDALRAHAKEKKREEAVDLVMVWWGRTQALLNYQEKLARKDAQFRAYAPKLLPDDERTRLKTLAVKEGIAPPPGKKRERKAPKVKAAKTPTVKATPKTKKVKPGKGPSYRIDLYDGDEVAKYKARKIAVWTKRTVAAVLKEHGRDATGKLVKK